MLTKQDLDRLKQQCQARSPSVIMAEASQLRDQSMCATDKAFSRVRLVTYQSIIAPGRRRARVCFDMAVPLKKSTRTRLLERLNYLFDDYYVRNPGHIVIGDEGSGHVEVPNADCFFSPPLRLGTLQIQASDVPNAGMLMRLLTDSTMEDVAKPLKTYARAGRPSLN